MEKAPSVTGEAIKRKLSLSDVADALGVSRPTLYRMIENYDTGDYGNLRGDAIRLFDIVTRDDIGPEEAQAFLLNLRREIKMKSTRPDEAGSPDLDRSITSVRNIAKEAESKTSDRSPKWTGEGEIRTCSFGQNGRSMVVFNGPEGRFRLRLWMNIGGEPYMLSEYGQTGNRRFFLVDDIIPRPDYKFDIVCETPTGEVSSGLQELRFR